MDERIHLKYALQTQYKIYMTLLKSTTVCNIRNGNEPY